MDRIRKASPIQLDVRNIFNGGNFDNEDTNNHGDLTQERGQNNGDGSSVENATRNCRNTATEFESSYRTFDERGYLQMPTAKNSERSDLYSYATSNGQKGFHSGQKCSCPQNTQAPGLDFRGLSSCRNCGFVSVSNCDMPVSISVREDSYVNLRQSGEYDNNTVSVKNYYEQPRPAHAHERVPDVHDPEIHDYNSVDYSQLRSTTGYHTARIQKVNFWRKHCNKCRISTAVVVILSLLAGIVAAVVIIRKQTPSPSVFAVVCKRYTSTLPGMTVEQNATTVYIKCDQGFRLNGSDVISCRSDGLWDSYVVCLPVDCGRYQLPPYALLLDSVSDTAFNTTLSVSCDIGYRLVNASKNRVICSETGQWIGNPECINKVTVQTSSSMVNFGDSIQISCNLDGSVDLRQLSIKSKTTDNSSSITLAMFNRTVSTFIQWVVGPHIRVTEFRLLSVPSPSVKVSINPVQCSDVLSSPNGVSTGDFIFSCQALHNSDVYENHLRVKVLQKPGPITLMMSYHVVEGYDSGFFFCEMHFAEADGYIDVQTDIQNPGTFETILNTTNGEYGTKTARIEDLKSSRPENCSFRTTVEFALKNVSVNWHRRHIKCVAYPSNVALNQTVITSETATIKVVPGDICSGVATGYLQNPYNCSRFITCESGLVKDDACSAGTCFSSASSSCSSRCYAKCPVTDIYFEPLPSKSGSATIVCIVEDTDGLTDIQISRGYGEIVTSLKNGVNLDTFVNLIARSFLNATGGVLVVEMKDVICGPDKYKCTPIISSGTPKEDWTSLKCL